MSPVLAEITHSQPHSVRIFSELVVNFVNGAFIENVFPENPICPRIPRSISTDISKLDAVPELGVFCCTDHFAKVRVVRYGDRRCGNIGGLLRHLELSVFEPNSSIYRSAREGDRGSIRRFSENLVVDQVFVVPCDIDPIRKSLLLIMRIDAEFTGLLRSDGPLQFIGVHISIS